MVIVEVGPRLMLAVLWPPLVIGLSRLAHIIKVDFRIVCLVVRATIFAIRF